MLKHNKILKMVKIGIHEWTALVIIAIGVLLRLIIISQNWPVTNSDESTMGLMALHIAQSGEHPTFMYGQNYMGSLEAFLGAGLFHLFGASTFTLRLGLIIIFVLFLISIYLLTSLLYSKNLALATLILLSLGADGTLKVELYAYGGYPETLLFGTLLFLIASWLALTLNRPTTHGSQWRRSIMFGCWGLAAGLGLWSDLLLMPFVLVAGILLIVGCWREWRTWAVPCLVIGFVIGAFPLLLYNFTALPGQDSLSVLLAIHDAAKVYHFPVISQVKGAFLVSLPIITSVNPTCSVISGRNIGFAGPHPFRCTVEYASWGLSYTLLWAIAIFVALAALWKLRSHIATRPMPSEERQSFMRHFARLMLLGSAGLAMFLYAISPNAALFPQSIARYLVGLLIVIPAVLSPLWLDTRTTTEPARIIVVAKGVLLLLIALVFLTGTIRIFDELPAAQAAQRQQDTLIHDLLHIGATRIYSDYWTCDRVIFQSDEKIMCAVIDTQGQVGFNRYTSYASIVKADPYAAYVLYVGSPPPTTFTGKAAPPTIPFQHLTFDGYDIYLPHHTTLSHHPNNMHVNTFFAFTRVRKGMK
ncbi:MAG: hypothetical protein ABI396_00970 [Ktedonobacteraceae bacterium]